MEKSLAGHFSGFTDLVFAFFFEPSPPHNSQRIDANTDATNNTTKTTHANTYLHILTHTNTTKHHQHTTRHITHLQHRYRPTSFQAARGLHRKHQDSCFLHDANMFRPTGNEPRPYALWPSRASQSFVYTEREPTERVIIVIVTEREEKREREEKEKEKEQRRKRTTEERKRRRTRERERGMERETRERREPTLLPPVCRFKTFPCVGSKCFRVYGQNDAHAEQHARVVPVHTEAF